MSKLDTYHYHEALDRAAMAQEIIDNTIMKHPVYESAPEEVKELVIKSIDMLHVYYVWACEQQDKLTEYIDLEGET